PSCTATVGHVPVEVSRVTVNSPRSLSTPLETKPAGAGVGVGANPELCATGTAGVGGRMIVIGAGALCGKACAGAAVGWRVVMQSSKVTPAAFAYLRLT